MSDASSGIIEGVASTAYVPMRKMSVRRRSQHSLGDFVAFSEINTSARLSGRCKALATAALSEAVLDVNIPYVNLQQRTVV